MVQKYTTAGRWAEERAVLTNDVYLAAYLLTQDCRLAKVMCNERRRVSFLMEGERAAVLRRRYRSGPVSVNVRFLREKVLTLRRLMVGEQRRTIDGKNRSAPCPRKLTRPDGARSPMR